MEDSKNMGGLRIMLRYGIKNKKKSIWSQKCPFNVQLNTINFFFFTGLFVYHERRDHVPISENLSLGL